MGQLPNKRRRTLYILAPLAFLLIFLALINGWLMVDRGTEMQTAVSVTGGPQTGDEGMGETAVIVATTQATATTVPTSTPQPTATATPTLPPDAQIKLFGPPDDALFRPDDRLSFYWQWPLPLAKDQFFQVVLLTEAGETLLGSVTEPNLGTQYRLNTTMSVAETAVSVQWQVRLTNINGDVLLSSESRTMRFLAP